MVFRSAPRRGRAALGLLLAGAALAPAACGGRSVTAGPAPEPGGETSRGVVMTTHDGTYRVEGGDRETVTMSVQAGGVIDGQQRFLGFHRWEITWTVDASPQAESCVVRDATVRLDSRMILPEWVEPPVVEPGLKEQWAGFLAALREHELGHRRIARAGAGKVREALLGVQAPTCEQVPGVANVAAQQVVDRIRVEDARYDEETRHGTTQGASWPPGR